MKLWMLLAVSWVSCTAKNDSQIQANQGAAEQPSWFKTPEEIKETIEVGYEISTKGDAQILYFDKLSELYGGKNQQNTKLTEPNGVYLLALDTLSNWLSCQLLGKEIESQGYVFEGGVYTISTEKDCDACYANDELDWCDCDDGITLDNTFSGEEINNEKRKRIMHNIQDIGDFLGIAIDDELPVDSYEHAVDYLYQRVFIVNPNTSSPSCVEPNDDYYDDEEGIENRENRESEDRNLLLAFEAWRRVIHAMLMSGPFYLNVNNKE